MNKNTIEGGNKKSSFRAIIPFIVFVSFYFGFSILAKDFSKVPMTVAFLVASAFAVLFNNGEKLDKKIELFATGMGNKDIMVMCLIYILAGGFTTTAKVVGGIDSAVLIAQHFIPAKFMVLGIFIFSALISLSIGSACGTIAAIAPIAISISQSIGIDTSFILGATVGGATFGDNMSLISDTKIAVSRTQNVELRQEMMYNLKIIAIPAILCIILYTLPIFKGTNEVINLNSLTIDNFVKVIPYGFVLILGVFGFNVIALLFLGTILNTVIGLFYGNFNIFGMFDCIGNGVISMVTTIIVAMLAGGLLVLIEHNGGINYILNKTDKLIKNEKTCEIGLCFLISIITLFTASNAVAIITAGPVCKKLSEKYNVGAVRTASLLDITSCVFQAMMPYGASMLVATSFSSSLGVNSLMILKGTFYPMLMFLGVVFSIILKRNKQ